MLVSSSPDCAAPLHASGIGKKKFDRQMWIERGVRLFLFSSACLCVLVTLGIVWVLFSQSLPFFNTVPFFDFLTGTKWFPLFEPRSFGVLPLVGGTMMIAFGSALVALPIGVATAIYLSEYASPGARNILKPSLELLAGVPTVVYGFFALTTLTPLLQKIFPSVEVFNAASAAMVVGVMVIPMIASISDDAIRAVPQHLRNAGYALGGTKYDVSVKIVVPAALSGIVASVVLALSRAIGETMAVTLAAGATPKLTVNFFESIQTMTGYIVQVSQGDTPTGSIEYQTIFAVGLGLFIITLLMNVFARQFLNKYRQKYD